MKTFTVGQRVQHVATGVLGTYRGTWGELAPSFWGTNDHHPHGVNFEKSITDNPNDDGVWWMTDDEIEVVNDDNA